MIFSCANLTVPMEIMQHVVRVESSGNPYAIGVVGGRLRRQPKNLSEAVATAKMLEKQGYNFSLGIAQVNRYNLAKYGLNSYEQAFETCPNLQAGSRILRECFDRSRDWGKSFSCYYSGNFVTGFRHGYVQKIFASMKKGSHTVRLQAQQAGSAPKVIVSNKRYAGAAPAAVALPTELWRKAAAAAERPTDTRADQAPVQAALTDSSGSATARATRSVAADSAFVF